LLPSSVKIALGVDVGRDVGNGVEVDSDATGDIVSLKVGFAVGFIVLVVAEEPSFGIEVEKCEGPDEGDNVGKPVLLGEG